MSSPPPDGLGFWLNSEAGITKDSSNRVTSWVDQGANGYVFLAQNGIGVPVTDPDKPVWTPNVINGLPALDFTGFSRILQYLISDPFAPGAPRTVLALCKQVTSIGGALVTFKKTVPHFACTMWDNGSGHQFGADWGVSNYQLNAKVDYSNVVTVVDWTLDAGALTVNVNGVRRAGAGTPSNETGFTAITIGNINVYGGTPTGGGYVGFITEILCYVGNNPATTAAARTYLMTRGGLLAGGISTTGTVSVPVHQTVIATDYVFDEFARTCDICGKPRRSDQLTVRDNIWICTLHKGYRRAKELDAINAKQRPFVLKPVKHTRPLNPSPTYLAEEGAIFNLVCDVAPFETNDTTSDGMPGITGTRSVSAASWGCLYLLSLVTEAKRPTSWLTQALAKAQSLGDYLISVQVGNGVLTTESGSNSVRFGAFNSAVVTAADCGVGCAALCKLYQTTGLSKYLTAAKNAANTIVNLQAGNLKSTGGTVAAYGPPTHTYTVSGVVFDNLYYPGDLVCLWALSLLQGIAGDGTYGAPGTVTAFYTAAPARLLSDSIAQQRAFWASGATDATGVTINGWSATTPRDYFDGANIAWDSTGLLTSASWADGLYAMSQVDGLTGQLTAIWDYLMTFQSNNTYATATNASDKVIASSATGTFDPMMAPATYLSTSIVANGSSYYDWGAAGLLAAFQSSRNPSGLAAAKEQLGIERHRTAEATPRDKRAQYIGRLGVSGLTFQPWSGDGVRRESVTRAAKTANLYRYRQVFGSTE